MSDKKIDIEEVLKMMREVIGQQVQEIAILKATISAMEQENNKVK